jgi:hypothetical protein
VSFPFFYIFFLSLDQVLRVRARQPVAGRYGRLRQCAGERLAALRFCFELFVFFSFFFRTTSLVWMDFEDIQNLS